ncbi:MAG: putative metal-dependent hydrolase [Cryomorphaceae bacterium]|jgi:predicted metal-dependent hydrolase
MTTARSNAMDNIVVRRLSFDMQKVAAQNPVWSFTHPLFSIYINALSIHIPYFERYLVLGMRKVKKQIENQHLHSDVTKIIGQEAHHAKNFIAINQVLAKRYPEVTKLDIDAKAYFKESMGRDSLKKTIGFIAGYETFTFLGGMIILKNYQKWMQDAEPVMRSVWVWHQVEEVEHGAVAFDVYKYFYADHEWYRKWMIVRAFVHVGIETAKAYIPMVRKEGYFKNPLKAAKAIGFFLSFSAQLAFSALPVFSKKYHPRNHPLANTNQNPLAVSWTNYYSMGEDVLQMDNADMQKMMEL